MQKKELFYLNGLEDQTHIMTVRVVWSVVSFLFSQENPTPPFASTTDVSLGSEMV